MHLQLVREPSSGRARLDLIRPLFDELWQNRLAEATANTSYALLEPGRTVEHVVVLAQQIMDSTTSMIERLLSQAPHDSVACHSGCAHCCHQRVGVTPPEALAIYFYLLKTRSSSQLRSLGERFHHINQSTRLLTANERLSSQWPCPFLHEQLCSIYPARPLSCRAVHSLDEQPCRDKLFEPQVREAYFNGTLAGHFFLQPLQASHAISAGLQLALSECFAWDMRPLDLNAVMAQLLDESAPYLSENGEVHLSQQIAPPVLVRIERWLRGEPAFETVRGGEASNQVRESAR